MIGVNVVFQVNTFHFLIISAFFLGKFYKSIEMEKMLFYKPLHSDFYSACKTFLKFYFLLNVRWLQRHLFI